MTQYRTLNPLGSMAPKDLYDNAQNVDNWSNGEEPFYEDRFGVMRRSFSGMNFEFDAAQTGRDAAFDSSQATKESRFQAFLVSSGYVSKGGYAAGVVLAGRNEYVAVDAATTGTSPGLYRPNASATLPLTLTGTWTTDSANLVMLGDDVLRQELADASGADRIGYGPTTLKEKVSEIFTNADIGPDIGLQMLDLQGRAVLLKQSSSPLQTPTFHRAERSQIDGGGSVVQIDASTTTSVAVRIGNWSTVSGFVFDCQVQDLDGMRATLELTDHATYDRCVFRGFRSPSSLNGWGIYATNTYYATIANCRFSDNTTYDITLVDDVHNTTVRNVDSEDGTGCIMVIEPNGDNPESLCTNTIVENSNFSYFGIMENASPGILTRGTIIRNSKATEILLQGGVGVVMENVEFDTINSNGMATELTTNCVRVGPELLRDNRGKTAALTGTPWVLGGAADSFSVGPEGVTLHDLSSSTYIYQTVTLSPGTYIMTADISVTVDDRNAINSAALMYGNGLTAHSKLFEVNEKGTRRGVRSVFFDVTETEDRIIGVIKEVGYFTQTVMHALSLRKLSKSGQVLPEIIEDVEFAFADAPTLNTSAILRAKNIDGFSFKSSNATVYRYVVRGGVVKAIPYAP